MRCPNCGWHVRGGARFCPNCGAEMPAEGPRTCPQCHAEIKGQVSLCPNCGAVLGGEAPEPAPEPPPEPAESSGPAAEEKGGAKRTCPNCKSELKGKVGICPVCGEDLSGPRPAARRPRAAGDWPFSAPADAAERPLASKMKPLSPNWPFDEPERPKKKKRSKKTRQAAESTAAAEKAGESKAAATKGTGEGKPKPAEKAKPAPAAPPKPPAGGHTPVNKGPESRGTQTKPPAGPPPAADRPPEVKPWYVARLPTEARPGPAAKQPTPPARPTRSPRPKAKPAHRPSPSLKPRQWFGLLPWLGGLAGLVVVSILVYGFAVGGLGLPHLGAAAPAKPTPTVQPTAAPTQTPQPTPTNTPPPTPSPTVEPVVHVVQPGESLLSIAEDYGIAVEDLIAANSITQSDVLRVGQELVIPGVSEPAAGPTTAPTEAAAEPTATPTEAPTEAQTEAPTATPATGETPEAQPTPQPTQTEALEFSAPNLLNPADGAVFGDEDILLNWSSVGLLGDDTWYVVKIWTDDPAQATPATGWTRTTAWRIPVSSRPPADAASHKFFWTVTVMRAVEGQEAVAVSPVSETRTFEWQ